jgi:hypothetical protein
MTHDEAITDLQERLLILEFVVGHLARKLDIEVELPDGFEQSVKDTLVPILERRKNTP